MLTRKEALELLKKNLRSENLMKHSYAVEVILQEMAKKLHQDEELWGLTGLLHDLDYDFTKN
jgi:putative nucleotidyltransferase with HDIG domain